MLETITLPKIEYQNLCRIKKHYEIMRRLFELDFFEEPPVKDIKKIIREFRQTGLYNESFLGSLEEGLKGSSYFSCSR